MWKKFTTYGAVLSIYTGLTVAVVLLVLSPTVWVDIVHKDEKAAVEKSVNDLKAAATAIDPQIAELQKQVVPADVIAKLKKKEQPAAEKKNADILASVTAKTKEKEEIAAKQKEAGSKMPQPIFPLKNPGIYSMAAAFLIGILMSLLSPEKEAQEKFESEKVRAYVGIGAE
jgi:cation/acetate symporter